MRMHKRHQIAYYDHVVAYEAHRARVAPSAPLEKFPVFPEFTTWLGSLNGVPTGASYRSVAEQAYISRGGAGTGSSIYDFRPHPQQKSPFSRRK
jgi:hypothetical protein